MPLVRHPDGRLAWLGNVRAIDDPHPIGLIPRLVHQGPVFMQQRGILPLPLPNTWLHGLDIAPYQLQGHRLDGLPLKGRHQPLQILGAPLGLCFAVIQLRKYRTGVHQLHRSIRGSTPRRRPACPRRSRFRIVLGDRPIISTISASGNSFQSSTCKVRGRTADQVNRLIGHF
jgi:hypothetical protein